MNQLMVEWIAVAVAGRVFYADARILLRASLRRAYG